MKFKVGDRVAVVLCDDNAFNNAFMDVMGELFTVSGIIEDYDCTWYDCGDINIAEVVLISETIYNSPLYKALS